MDTHDGEVYKLRCGLHTHYGYASRHDQFESINLYESPPSVSSRVATISLTSWPFIVTLLAWASLCEWSLRASLR